MAFIGNFDSFLEKFTLDIIELHCSVRFPERCWREKGKHLNLVTHLETFSQ